MSVEQTLADKGITLPEAPMPAANYVPFVQTGNLVFISGQISADENGLITGKLGDGTSVEDGAAAARRCGLALIAQLKSAVGDLDRVARVVKLTGFVNSTPDFTDQPKVINGCSNLMVEVFGDAGRHSRAAVSAPSLPFGVAVEIEAIFEVK
ncbi:MAG: RidA family protein [Paracoccus sp. (in: a-proteobacteria)]|uniref:RidA family protein n=1 Tax=Paracoccus sp. TaxID=267 RepID=UPI003242CDDF